MPRIIVIHSRDPIINLTLNGEENPAHCFGPFSSYQEALRWDAIAPDDCYKIALDLVGPWPADLQDEPVHGSHHGGWAGSGPSARPGRTDA